MDEIIEQHYLIEPKISDILYEYIDKYPEDAPKWVEYFNFNTNENENSLRRRYGRYYSQQSLDTIIQAMNFPIEIDTTVNITHETGCLHCKKTWDETPRMATMEMLCGHKYHTLCSFLFYHNHDSSICLVDSCNSVNIMSIVNRISILRNRRTNDIEEVLTDAILKNKDFQDDLKLMKKQISVVNRSIGVYHKKSENIRKKILKKHLHSINYIQSDMNEATKQLAFTEEKKNVRSSISKYRKTAASMFRNYHVSFRDLYRKNMIKANWRLRHVLERHGSIFSSYKFGIRIRPGKKIWRDPQIDTDIPPSTEF
jgi:hypothetical protein